MAIANLLATLLCAHLAMGQQCVPGTRGPTCSSDSDCQNITSCVRCAHSGHCTDVPAPGPSPGPSPGPHPSPAPSPSQDGCTPADHSYDYLMLVQGWPNSNSVQKDVPFAYGSLDYWTLHGLWPSRSGSTASTYPCQCDERGFDKSAIASIQDQVTKYWPSFKGDDGFWEHEWTKHGTCASDVSELKDELGFFKKTLDLRESHDIGAALKNASIEPDSNKQYTADQLTKALTTIDGFKPLLGCLSKGGVQYLHEVSFCFDKTLKDINCDDSIRTLPHDEVSDCDLSQPIVYIEPATQSDVIV